jgi:hypothetical protein
LIAALGNLCGGGQWPTIARTSAIGKGRE